MSDTLAANEFATFDEYERARIAHDRNAARILYRIVGASIGDMDADVKGRLWDQYVGLIREWDAATPEWVRSVARLHVRGPLPEAQGHLPR